MLEISRKRAHLKYNFKYYSPIPADSGFPCQKILKKLARLVVASNKKWKKWIDLIYLWFVVQMNLTMNIEKDFFLKLLEISRKRAHLKHNFKRYSSMQADSGFPCQKTLEKKLAHLVVASNKKWKNELTWSNFDSLCKWIKQWTLKKNKKDRFKSSIVFTGI